MFEALGERIQGVFKELRGEGHLTEYHLDSALRQIRLSLLEADVALPVVREFTARVKEKAVGAKVMQQLSPAQEVTRIVRDELMALLGGQKSEISPRRAAGGHRAGRPAGLGQDDVGGQARAPPEVAGPLPAARGGRPLASRGRLAAEDARAADRRSGLRSGRAHATRSTSRARASRRRG